jgi:hypothetical protein
VGEIKENNLSGEGENWVLVVVVFFWDDVGDVCGQMFGGGAL